METRDILSVGIDVGTTTTQLIFSRLRLVNRAGPTQVPRFEFAERRILFSSPVVFTPKDERGAIRRPELEALVKSWFELAGMKFSDIETGAIIITGESLKATNARDTVMGLAEGLGDFVVATAGPHLESIIAGRGSGAASWSEAHGATVLNIDVGGGTANYAVFSLGRVADTACLNVGGRLIETDPRGRATRIHTPAEPVVAELFGPGTTGLGPRELARVAERMADMIYAVAVGTPDPLAEKLLQTPPLAPGQKYDAVFVSGGVGACLYGQTPGDNPGDPFRFGDLGPLLAAAIRRHPGMNALPLREPACTIQATVIGAGAWSLSLSGSTIWADAAKLPLKNIPVAVLPLDWREERPDIAEAISRALSRLDLDPGRDLFAAALPPGMPVTYRVVRHLAAGLARFFSEHAASPHPVLVVLREDAGKVLGMELAPLLPGRELAVIDEVEVRDGDYIDLGRPLYTGGLVPLTIKSLAFSA